MKKIIFTFLLLISALIIFSPNKASADELSIKSQAYVLYNTNNLDETLKLLNSLPDDEKDEEVYVIIANVYEDKNNVDKAVENLNHSLRINPEYYKAYYNLGCIFLCKKAYNLAEKNLLLAIKYNKDFAHSYYNLGTLYIKTGDFDKAKKNLLKAIYLKNDEKDFYLNLAYAYKFLGKEKDAKRFLEIYNSSK